MTPGNSHPPLRSARHLLVFCALLSAGPLVAQDLSPLERVQTFDLDTIRSGDVTVHFPPSERARAEELATLTREASAWFEREMGIAFDLGVVALTPEDWFEPIPGIPYAVPWNSVPERLIFTPSSMNNVVPGV